MRNWRLLGLELPSDSEVLGYPSLLERRWKEIKTAIFNLAQNHQKNELILALLKLRERYTSGLTLTEITYFTGFDVAIHTLQRWNWTVSANTLPLDVDALDVGKYGAELMIIHTIKESLKNGMLSWDEAILETEIGKVHFQALNSFNIDITGSRSDIAKKRYSQDRTNKHRKKMDPVYKLPSVRRLYAENSMLMLVRAPLPFYFAMNKLTISDRKYLTKLYSKLISRTAKNQDGVVRVRLKQGSNAVRILRKLQPAIKSEYRRPHFIACLELNKLGPDKIEYAIPLGALSMFMTFLQSMDKDHLKEKAVRAESAVKDVIEYSGLWQVVESNAEIKKSEKEVITEIDLIAKSLKHENKWLNVEVKDFSFWKGWIFGQGADMRKNYYLGAIKKIYIKENYIREHYAAEEINSIIVTSIPEPHMELDSVQLVYMSDLPEYLSKAAGINYSSRKRHSSSNFLIRYFERLTSDYENADAMNQPIEILQSSMGSFRDKLDTYKDEYENARSTLKMINFEYEALIKQDKLTRKRLILDTGERHYQIEDELAVVKENLNKSKRNKKIRLKILIDLKTKYTLLLGDYKKKEIELNRLTHSKERLLASRLY